MSGSTGRWVAIIAVVLLALTVGAMSVSAADPTTIASSTMVFEGALTDDGDGSYSGTIPMIDETGTGQGDGVAGFDVYARDGEMATYDKAGSGSQDYACGAVSQHDAYTTGGGWGSYYDPDCADWEHYQLRLDGDNWYLEYVSGGTAYAPPMSGSVDWCDMYASETGAGAYYSGMGTPESAGYALSNGCTGTNDGSQAWDMDWSWGSEYIPLELPGFDVTVEDIGGGDYRVTLSPGDPPNTVASGTMIFRGALTDLGGGVYQGSIAMIDEEALGVGDGIAGYDVYARNGAAATWYQGGTPAYACGLVTNHDAYTSGGGWGTYYDPDCADWDNYQLRLEAGMWYVEYNSNVGNDGILTGAVGAPLSGNMDWTNMYADETGVGAYYAGSGAASPGYALNNACTGTNDGKASWDMDWSWGSDYVPLSFPGFDVMVDDLGGGQYQVTLTPAKAKGGAVAPGPIVNETTGESYGMIQTAVDDASYGDVIVLTNTGSCYDGGVVMGTPGVTLLGEEGACIGAGSPAYTVTAADCSILNQVLTGDTTSEGIVVLAGGDNLTIEDCEIRNWFVGVEIRDSVASFKMIGNWIHDNDIGFRVWSGTTLSGVVTIEGNLFKDNTNRSVTVSTQTIDCTYNSWGTYDNPATGGNIMGSVLWDPWTYAEVYMDMVPDTAATTVAVYESDTFDVALKLDARELTGLTFKLEYDTDFLVLNSVTFSTPFAGNESNLISPPVAGEEAYRITMMSPVVGLGMTVATLNFTAADDGTHAGEEGSWDQYIDIIHTEAETSAGAPGGVKIWVNNAGWGDPSIPARDITDTDDGHVAITGIAQYTGFCDLQGRPYDSGATVEISQKVSSVTTKKAIATSASSGAWTSAYETGELLVVGETYDISIDAPLYLPSTVNSVALDDRPLTDLAQCKLLGGDATDDNSIDIGDISMIGGRYGLPAGTVPNADVNADGIVDILDLVLAAGNYGLSVSSWTA